MDISECQPIEIDQPKEIFHSQVVNSKDGAFFGLNEQLY